MKKAQISSTKVVGAIIAILVLLLVAGFLVEKNPNWLYKLLPDVNPTIGQDEEIIVPVGPDGKPVEITTCSTDGKVMVARVLGGTGEVIQIGRYQQDGTFALTNADYNAFNKDSVTWDAASDSVSVLGQKVGRLINGKVEVDKVYLTEDSLFYFQKMLEGEKITAKDLAILDGAELKGTYFCKSDADNLISSDYIGPWPDSYGDLYSVDWTSDLGNVVFNFPSPAFFGDILQYFSLAKKAKVIYLPDKEGLFFIESTPMAIVPRENFFEVYSAGKIYLGKKVGIIATNGYLYLDSSTFYREDIPKLKKDYLPIVPPGLDVSKNIWEGWWKTPYHVDYKKLSDYVISISK